ncbi:MAG: Hsp20/alpha crystallin family protein [Flavobacteriaceae bacterium]|nr:Hsp20/alpha crystallin family protein [Flavobacteriaceae bacterium]
MLVKSSSFPLMTSFFDDFYKDWSTTNFSDTNTSLPAVNIKENDHEFIVEVAVPGMDKNDFKIDLDNNILTISSEKVNNNQEQKYNYTRREYSYQSFKRSFTLPKNIVDSEKIKARYNAGELVIEIPKKEEAKPIPARLIEIQ